MELDGRTPRCPDRVIFDLDPGKGVAWVHVQEAALLMQTLLEEIDRQAWLKTSGRKGVHVVRKRCPTGSFVQRTRVSRRKSFLTVCG